MNRLIAALFALACLFAAPAMAQTRPALTVSACGNQTLDPNRPAELTVDQTGKLCITGALKQQDGSGNSIVGDPCQINAHSYWPINISSAANTKIVAGASAKKTYICHVFLYAAAADNVGIVEGSGTNCASSTLGLIGGATAATGVNLSANQGFVEGAGSHAIAASTVNANDVCLITSASSQLSGVMVTVQQ